MRKTFAILAAAGCLAVPIAAHGATASTSSTCTTLRSALGTKSFNETYGSSTKDKKALSKCVSATKGAGSSKKLIKKTEKAVKACAKDRKASSKAFAKKYGKKKAFAKCVAKRVNGGSSYTDPFGP